MFHLGGLLNTTKYISLTIAVGAVSLFSACGESSRSALRGPGESCVSTADCKEGLSCVDHICIQDNSDASIDNYGSEYACEEGQASCKGLECGDDGCGGYCGDCPAGRSCQSGRCEVKCGDGQCDESETRCGCPSDCGTWSGCCSGSVNEGGWADTQCGMVGVECVDCTAIDKLCYRQACVEKPWYDLLSGLTWQVEPTNKQMDWSTANSYCSKLELDGKGWRLPTIGELRSLIRDCPALELGGSCNIHEEGDCLSYTCKEGCKGCGEIDGRPESDYCFRPPKILGKCTMYWSSSPDGELDDHAWGVSYFYMSVSISWSPKFSTLYVRCVR